MVRDVTDMMQMRAQEKGLWLSLDQSSAFPRYVKGDEARLRQVLVNLAGNAVKFTKQGGITVRLSTKVNGGRYLVMEVEDTGPGMGAEDRKRLFKPFVQLGEAGTQKGTGLGLAISRQFIELMGGTINVESTPGKGSVFRVEVPAEEVPEAGISALEEAAPARQVAGLTPGQPAYRIVIAEDQRENQMLLDQLMARIGLEVKVAENGQECVKLFQEWHPHLIWMDRRMPVMNGVEATRAIRQLPGGKDVKIVAVTASVFKEQQQEMLDAGMDDFVSKPYRAEEIYDCLARQLGVRYVYETAKNTPEAKPAPAGPIAGKLAALPAGVRKELADALESLDSERIAAIILQIGQADAELGKSLRGLAENFDYPVILNALAPETQTPDGRAATDVKTASQHAGDTAGQNS
jgi:CheY-like chemotaxis protein